MCALFDTLNITVFLYIHKYACVCVVVIIIVLEKNTYVYVYGPIYVSHPLREYVSHPLRRPYHRFRHRSLKPPKLVRNRQSLVRSQTSANGDDTSRYRYIPLRCCVFGRVLNFQYSKITRQISAEVRSKGPRQNSC